MTNHEDMANYKNMQITEEIENLEKKIVKIFRFEPFEQSYIAAPAILNR